jgi:hypothetical protein
VVALVGQRVFAIALGNEDLNDHDKLRHDPMMAVLAGKLEARREDCAPVRAGSAGADALMHGEQEDRFFHGYYDCYCYLPLYVFCGRHLLDAKLRRASLLSCLGMPENPSLPHRTSLLLADIVAKVANRRAIIFPPKDDMTGDRRSLYSQSRYQGRQ